MLYIGFAINQSIDDDMLIMFHEGYKAECVHARNCARPRVLSAAVNHVQGDDYPVYSDYVALPPRPR